MKVSSHLNPRATRDVLRSGDRKGEYATEKGGMPRRELEDFKDSTIDALEALAIAPNPDFRTRFPVTDADAALRSVLRDHLAATIELLDGEDRFYRKHENTRLLAFLRAPSFEPLGALGDFRVAALPTAAAPDVSQH